MAQIFKLRFGDDLRRYSSSTPLSSLEELRNLCHTLFQIPPSLVQLTFMSGDVPVVLTPDSFPVLQVLNLPVIPITVSVQEPVPFQGFPSIASDALPLPYSVSFLPPSSAAPFTPSPSPTPAPTQPAPQLAPVLHLPTFIPHKPTHASVRSPRKKEAGTSVPMKYRVMIWSLQDEFPEATEFRVLQLLIKLALDVPTIRQQLRELQSSQVLRRDNGRRGRPKRQPAPPLYFPVPFQEKVRTLVQCGFEQDRVIDVLIQYGGSAKHASLALIGENPMSASIQQAAVRVGADASIRGATLSPLTEPTDHPLTMDQRVVDSLLLLQRTHGFDTHQIYKAAESIARSPSSSPDVRAREAVINSIPAATVEALNSLSQMGFSDTVGNIVLLEKHKGDLSRVIDELMGRNRWI